MIEIYLDNTQDVSTEQLGRFKSNCSLPDHALLGDPPDLVEVTNVLVDPGTWAVLDSEGVLLEESLYLNPYTPEDLASRMASRVSIAKLDRACIFLNRACQLNYYHWLVQGLASPRVV